MEKIDRNKFIELMNEDWGDWGKVDNAFEGLKILSKYTNNLIQGSRKDVIFSEYIDKLIEKGITVDDVKKLRSYNWMIEEDEYLVCFV